MQSLIAIQAAYINTNHPSFVKGSAIAAQNSTREAQARRQAQLEPKRSSSDDDENGDRSGGSGADEEEDTVGSYVVPNGRAAARLVTDGAKSRSASSTIHDRHKGGPDFAAASSSSHAAGTSGSRKIPGAHHLTTAQAPPAFASPYGASPSSSTAKESFLNYFFGGSEMNTGADGRGAGGRNAIPDFGGAGARRERARQTSAAERGDNPLSGRRGLEGNAAAFDMKSLDKHLEAVSLNVSCRPLVCEGMRGVDTSCDRSPQQWARMRQAPMA